MVPGNSIISVYTRIMGGQALLSIAQGNLLSDLERISKTRTHTFLAFNGQTKNGISQNYGPERHYGWEDTTIDCRHTPELSENNDIEQWNEALSGNARFVRLCDDLEDRMDGLVAVRPFHSVLRGEDNMRYNIKRKSKIIDFDTIRVGVVLTARNEDAFKTGLDALKESENPIKIKRQSVPVEPLFQMA